MHKFSQLLAIVVVVLLTLSISVAQNSTGLEIDRVDHLDFESWECVDRMSRAGRQKVVLRRMFYSLNKLSELSELDRKEIPDVFLDGGGVGSVSFSTVRHLAILKVSGLDLEWWWGGGSGEFLFSIEPNGMGIYQDLRPSTARGISLFECKKQRLSQKEKKTAKIDLLEFMRQNTWRFEG
ncbi:MAG: hypothetical protein OXG05_11410 [Gammaproteobacteria bacterium]|nr:hypothetical protein [Gammaproteobacteria bacterium]